MAVTPEHLSYLSPSAIMAGRLCPNASTVFPWSKPFKQKDSGTQRYLPTHFLALFIAHQAFFLLGTGQPFDFVALDPGTEHGILFHEKFMIVGISFRPFADALKVVEIQLSLEGRERAHLKILGHDIPCKFLRLVDTESKKRIPREEQGWLDFSSKEANVSVTTEEPKGIQVTYDLP